MEIINQICTFCYLTFNFYRMDFGVAYLICILFIEVVVATTIEKANQLLSQNRLPEALDAYSDVISKDAK